MYLVYCFQIEIANSVRAAVANSLPPPQASTPALSQQINVCQGKFNFINIWDFSAQFVQIIKLMKSPETNLYFILEI